MVMNFRKIGYSGLIPLVYEGKEEIHKYMQYETSLTLYVDSIPNQRKVPKWLPFNNCKSE